MGNNPVRQLGIQSDKKISSADVRKIWERYDSGTDKLSWQAALQFLQDFSSAVNIEYTRELAERMIVLCSKSGVKGDLEYDSFLELVVSISSKAQKTTNVHLTQSLMVTRDMMMDEDRLRLSSRGCVPVGLANAADTSQRIRIESANCSCYALPRLHAALMEVTFVIVNDVDTPVDARFRLPLQAGSVVCRWSYESCHGTSTSTPVPSSFLDPFRLNGGQMEAALDCDMDTSMTSVPEQASFHVDEHDHSLNITVFGLPPHQAGHLSVSYRTSFTEATVTAQSIHWTSYLPFSFISPVSSLSLNTVCYPIDEFHWDTFDTLAGEGPTTIAAGVEFGAATTAAPASAEEEEITKRLLGSSGSISSSGEMDDFDSAFDGTDLPAYTLRKEGVEYFCAHVSAQFAVEHLRHAQDEGVGAMETKTRDERRRAGLRFCEDKVIVCILWDVSNSQEKVNRETVVKVLQQMGEQLASLHLAVSVTLWTFSRGVSLEVEEGSMEEVLEHIEGLEYDGGTYFDELAEIIATDQRSDAFVIVSDGEDSSQSFGRLSAVLDRDEAAPVHVIQMALASGSTPADSGEEDGITPTTSLTVLRSIAYHGRGVFIPATQHTDHPDVAAEMLCGVRPVIFISGIHLYDEQGEEVGSGEGGGSFIPANGKPCFWPVEEHGSYITGTLEAGLQDRVHHIGLQISAGDLHTNVRVDLAAVRSHSRSLYGVAQMMRLFRCIFCSQTLQWISLQHKAGSVAEKLRRAAVLLYGLHVPGCAELVQTGSSEYEAWQKFVVEAARNCTKDADSSHLADLKHLEALLDGSYKEEESEEEESEEEDLTQYTISWTADEEEEEEVGDGELRSSVGLRNIEGSSRPRGLSMEEENPPQLQATWVASPGQDFQYSHLDAIEDLCEGLNRKTEENGLLDAVHQKYLATKSEHPGGSPWFYLCLADYLWRADAAFCHTRLSRMVTNALEAGSGSNHCPQLMRSVASFFLTMGWPHQAVGLLERVIALEPLVPQPYIDLALAIFVGAKSLADQQTMYKEGLRAAEMISMVLTRKWAGEQRGVRVAAIYWLTWIDLYVTGLQLPSVWPAAIPEYMRIRQPAAPKAVVCLQWDLPAASLQLVVESPTGEVWTSGKAGGSGPEMCFLLDDAKRGSYTVTAVNESGGDHFCTVSAFVCVNPCRWAPGEPDQERTSFLSIPMNLSSSDREILGSFLL